MKDVTRREILGAGALAGAVAIAGMTPRASRAQDDPKPKFDEEAERRFVMEVGMTEAEADCWLHQI